MKHFFCRSLCLCFLMMTGINASADVENVEIDGITYDINIKENEATVTMKKSGIYTEDVIIPPSVTYEEVTYPVTGIDRYAFSGSSVTSITIPNSVTSIAEWAFYGFSCLTPITIPNSITSISPYTFFCSDKLTSINIPNSVTSIGYAAFYGCSGLTSFSIPNSVTDISDAAFSGCSGLTSIIIPSGVTTIGNAVFMDCSSLTSITIPNSVTSIGGYAFENTAWYNNQPDGLVYVGFVAYKYKGTMQDDTSIIIKEGTKSISDLAFLKCSGLTSVTIPNSVTSIGYEAFYGCSGLTSVTIPNSVMSIGDEAFAYCTALTKVTSMIEEPFAIESNVFKNLPSDATLYVPVGTKAKYEATEGWSNFTNIVEMEPPFGDLNGDGKVDIADVTVLLNIILGKEGQQE